MIRFIGPMLVGFSIWALAFLALYALQALGCVWGWSDGVQRGVLVFVFTLTVGLQVALLRRQLVITRAAPTSLRSAALGLTTASIVASAVTFAPVVFVSLCI